MKRIVAILSVLGVLVVSAVASAPASASLLSGGQGTSIECTVNSEGKAEYTIKYGHGKHELKFTFGSECLI